MDYTSIHIYGHLLSDDILHNIERDNTYEGNREQDFAMDIPVSAAIDYVWSSLRNDWSFYNERANNVMAFVINAKYDVTKRHIAQVGTI